MDRPARRGAAAPSDGINLSPNGRSKLSKIPSKRFRESLCRLVTAMNCVSLLNECSHTLPSCGAAVDVPRRRRRRRRVHDRKFLRAAVMARDRSLSWQEEWGFPFGLRFGDGVEAAPIPYFSITGGCRRAWLASRRRRRLSTSLCGNANAPKFYLINSPEKHFIGSQPRSPRTSEREPPLVSMCSGDTPSSGERQN